jgi:hypothetical protein
MLRRAQSFATSESRVWSPSAANTRELPRVATILLWRFGDMSFDILHLLDPAAVIHAKSFQAALTGDFVKPDSVTEAAFRLGSFPIRIRRVLAFPLHSLFGDRLHRDAR